MTRYSSKALKVKDSRHLKLAELTVDISPETQMNPKKKMYVFVSRMCVVVANLQLRDYSTRICFPGRPRLRLGRPRKSKGAQDCDGQGSLEDGIVCWGESLIDAIGVGYASSTVMTKKFGRLRCTSQTRNAKPIVLLVARPIV